MALYSSSSRYSTDSAGQTGVRGPIRANRYTLYTVREGDTLESISGRIFGTTERYWEIADINPQIKFPLNMSTGDVIRIPL
jgi:nucleoid-associated protein YgaU